MSVAHTSSRFGQKRERGSFRIHKDIKKLLVAHSLHSLTFFFLKTKHCIKEQSTPLYPLKNLHFVVWSFNFWFTLFLCPWLFVTLDKNWYCVSYINYLYLFLCWVVKGDSSRNNTWPRVIEGKWHNNVGCASEGAS